jgi:hypothetical protein
MGPNHLHQIASMEVGAIDENDSPKCHGVILEQRAVRYGVTRWTAFSQERWRKHLFIGVRRLKARTICRQEHKAAIF